jgi:hypothetical protein
MTRVGIQRMMPCIALIALVSTCVPVLTATKLAGAVTPTTASGGYVDGSLTNYQQLNFNSVSFNGLRGGYPTFTMSGSAGSFQAWFAAPAGQALVPGDYEGAQRFDFRSPGAPGIDVFGNGAGCNTNSGDFYVDDITFDSQGNVLTFAAQFAFYCEGETQNPDVGAIAYNENPTFVNGYYMDGADGGLYGFGDAGYLTLLGDLSLDPLNEPVVGMALTPSQAGYWMVAADGGIFSFGDAQFHGSTGAIRLNKPIVGMASTPDGKGYWFVASDGGVFSFGDARFFGSTGAIRLNQPIVGMASTPDGGGYWLVAADGGIFSFGDAQFYGSTGAIRLNKPIVGMASTPDGKGYWFVASDGGVFAFGDAQFYGSTGNIRLNQPIVGMASTPDGGGYWLVAADGGVFDFGDAQFGGSLAGQGVSNVVGVSS